MEKYFKLELGGQSEESNAKKANAQEKSAKKQKPGK